MQVKRLILDEQTAQKKLERMALEIAEQFCLDETEIIIIGIKKSGWIIAQQLEVLLKHQLQNSLSLIEVSLDKHYPNTVMLSKAVDFNQKNILLVDDVANSGKTLLYALKPLLDFHPKSIHTAVLVERSYKQFPVKPDFVGLSLSTTQEDHIEVVIDDNHNVRAYLHS